MFVFIIVYYRTSINFIIITTRKEGANWKKHGGRPHVALILLPKQFDQVWLFKVWHSHHHVHRQSHGHEETTSTLKREREWGGGGGGGVRGGRTEGDKLHVLYYM